MRSGTTITVRRRYAVPRTRVFGAFERAEALAKWFSPDPAVGVEVLVFKFEVGGVYRCRYDFPDGTQAAVGGKFKVIRAPEELVFSWIWEKPDRHADIATEVAITFLSRGSGTEIVLSHSRLPSEEAMERYVTGWEGNLGRLDAMLST